MSLTKYTRAQGKKHNALAKRDLRKGGLAILERAEIIHEGGHADGQIVAISDRWLKVKILGGGVATSLLDFAPWRIGPRDSKPTTHCVGKPRKWTTAADANEEIWVQLDLAGHSGPRQKLVNQYVFLGYAPTQKVPRLAETKNTGNLVK